jgi:selenocysteine lyase/cysteine desulfurase
MTLADRSADFAGFDGWAYLNCAYHGPIPRVAEEALAAAVALRRNPAFLSDRYHFSFPDAYRRAIAGLIGCGPGEVALTDSTTRGMMLLAGGLDWRDGDEVVIPRGEFPANRLPWLWLGRRGVTVRVVDLGGGAGAAERIEAALSPRTRLVTVSWVGYSDGRRLDLGSISRLCRDRGVLFAVDGSQGVGGLPLDLASTPCDLLACSGYKWLLGPYGLGFAYVAPALAERLEPADLNWFGMEGAEDFNALAELPLRPRPGARRFDANETANFFNVAAGTAAARWLAGIGPAAVEAHCAALHRRLIAGLPSGFTPLGGFASDAPAGTLRSNILCLRGADRDTTARAFRLLRRRRVAVSSRESYLRVSPHLYNTLADVDRLLEALTDAAAGRDAEGEPPPEPADPRRRIEELLGSDGLAASGLNSAVYAT